MNTVALREHIDSTLRQIAEQHGVASLLATRLDDLHHSLHLPGTDAATALQRFVPAYVRQVPQLLEATTEAAAGRDEDRRIERALGVAEQFLLGPAAGEDALAGLENLLAGAYLAHRLVEEINDRHRVRCARPLLALDATLANLVMHQLLGEDFANQLDAVVERVGDGLLRHDLFAAPADRQDAGQAGLASGQCSWPDPAVQAGIALRRPDGQPQRSADLVARRSAS